MCVMRIENKAATKVAIEDERGQKMRHALWEAKVAMYEARHQSERLADDLHGRIDNVFRTVEQLFLDARSEADKHRAEIEALMDAEYGPSLERRVG